MVQCFLLIIVISTFHIILRNKTLTELRKVWLAQSCNYNCKKFQPKIVAKLTPRKVSRKTSAKKKVMFNFTFLIWLPTLLLLPEFRRGDQLTEMFSKRKSSKFNSLKLSSMKCNLSANTNFLKSLKKVIIS